MVLQRVNGAQPDLGRIAASEVGVSGLKVFGGRVFEEFLVELRGPQGVKVFEQMRRNDPMIGSVLRATKDTIRSVEWYVPEEEGIDLPKAEFLASCMDDMSHSWFEFTGEALSVLPFGWAYHEVVYKMREGPDGETPSRYEDGRIGWRKIALRGQDSLMRWEFDPNGGIRGMWQQALSPLGQFQQAYIPIEKAVLFRTDREKNNPEGVSMLRPAYTAYYKKSNLEEIEAIAAEREATGHLLIRPPVGADEGDRNAAQDILERYKVDDQMGFYLPRLGKEEWERWDVSIIATPGERSIDLDRSIQRYQGEIAMAFLAQFLRLGQSGQKVGSYALSRDQRDLFHLSIKSILDNMEETVNRFLVPPLMRLNAVSEPWPKIKHGRIGQRDLAALSTYIRNLFDVGGFVPDRNVRQFLREEADLPLEADSAKEPEVPVRRRVDERRDRTGEKPRSEVQPQDEENPRQREMIEAEDFVLTDEMFARARKRMDRLYAGVETL